MKVTEIENENRQLSKRLKSAESEKKSAVTKYKKLKEKVAAREEKRKSAQNSALPPTAPQRDTEEESDGVASSVPESPVPQKVSRSSVSCFLLFTFLEDSYFQKRRHSNHRHRAFEPSVLDRVFEDVASIVNSHMSRTESSGSLENEPESNSKWRQLYENVYSELEKLRNLLMIQHRVNERHKQEVQNYMKQNLHKLLLRF